MFKNYLLINSILGIVLASIIFLIIRTTQAPVEWNVEIPDEPVSSQSPLMAETNPDAQDENRIVDNYEIIFQKNLTHPERMVPETPTPSIDVTPTSTSRVFDCNQTGITLSGIVLIENGKDYCFLNHPVETKNQPEVFYLNSKLGDYTVTEILEDSVIITAAADNSTCELLLFDFSNTTQSGSERVRPTPRRSRPTPTPRRVGVSN